MLLVAALYVNDLLITGPEGQYLTEFKTQMKKVFEMTDLGEMTYFLGMEVIQSTGKIVLHQVKYAKDLLNRFKMSMCKAVSTPLSTGSKFCRDDGTAKANGQFMQDPTETHFTVDKRILRYVKGTMDYGLVAVFAWNSKQQVVAQSTAEAEYIACAATANHALWLRKLLVELGFKQVKGTLLNVDNMSTIAIAKNPVQQGTSESSTML
ncbi:PREDICTED: uncharacterized mitochondrial protein AtMg00810 [Theobroma cacao]|uniref:Uncharacterized mitochondrial protein AtMg00810 n=1 Tax=Theobroma cacao TaxID=3641 RepID=A0AB32WN80_THECC|nr:PREDICTED: uncharacterized mitochondrial protein AtMg00810 [Theobroma cacao]